MKSRLFVILAGVFVLCSIVYADSHIAGNNGNPVVPGYFADPTVRKFGDTYYMYATTDGTNLGTSPASVWTSKDFVNWTYHTLNWPTTRQVWAPEVIKNEDGKYYYYYSQSTCNIYGGSSDTPMGPWKPLTDNAVIVRNHLVENVITLDGQIFEEDDGSKYMFWGTWATNRGSGAGVGKFNADMKSFSDLYKIPNTQARDFFEGPLPIKKDGVYYFTYSSGSCHTDTYRVQYAVSTEGILGPYTFGANNPILSTSADGTVHGPGHHCIHIENDTYYMVYHRHDNPHSAGGCFRQLAVDVMEFGPDNSIEKVKASHKGIGYLAASTNPFENLAYNKKVKVSSANGEDYKAEFGLDNNNGTQWRAATNALPAWMEVDLGKVENIKRTYTEFEYMHWYYQYLIEYSVDGKSWKVFSDKRNNYCAGSPMVDYGDIEARYLRLTITGVEKAGLCPAVWNFKAFGSAKEDPQQMVLYMEASDVSGGEVKEWANNKGMLGGKFVSKGSGIKAQEVDGKKAIVFDGKSTMKSSFKFPTNENGQTFAAWVYINDSNLNQILRVGENTISANGCESGKWYHLAVTRDDSISRYYIDGRKITQASSDVKIANDNFVMGENFDGAIANMRIFFRKLEPAEIEYYMNLRYRRPAEPAPKQKGLIVHVDARDLQVGTSISKWDNKAEFGGSFEGRGNMRVGIVSGRQAVTFDGQSSLRSSFDAPLSLSGNGSYTVACWAYNPQIGDEESLVSWSRRNGSDTTAATLGFGTNRNWGVMAHWGWGDISYGRALPSAEAWHHIAATFDGTYVKIYVDGEQIHNERMSLFLFENLPINIGAAPSNHAPFSGSISSVRLYDIPLSAEEIKKLANEKQTSDILVNINPGRCAYGKVARISNEAALGGEFVSVGDGVEVKDVAGKIALSFDGGGHLKSSFENVDQLEEPEGYSIIAVVYDKKASDEDILKGGAWNHIVVSFDGKAKMIYVNGKVSSESEIKVNSKLNLAGGMYIDRSNFGGAIASLTVKGKAMSDSDVEKLYAVFDKTLPGPNPASFTDAPKAVSTSVVVMTAAEATDDSGAVQYYFEEISGNSGGKSSGWVSEPMYMNFGLAKNSEYIYAVKVRDASGNVTQSSTQVKVKTDPSNFNEYADDFEVEHDFLADGVDGTMWDGFVGKGENESVGKLAIADGKLRIESQNTNWDGASPKGPFIYKAVEGDFIAEVHLTDAAGLARRRGGGNNEAGIMVRIGDIASAGRGEDFLQLGFFPAYNCGSLWSNVDNGRRPQGFNGKAWDADKYMQIQKVGDQLFLRTSADGVTWTDMDDSPFVRRDMAGEKLQVGLYNATYGDTAGFGEFDNFKLSASK